MGFQSLLTISQRLSASMEALAAISAELRLRQSDVPTDPRVRARLRDVIESIEPGLLDGLSGDQQATVLGSINAFFRQALDMIDDPGRSPGWSFKDPAILQSYGQMSRGVVHAIDEDAFTLVWLAAPFLPPEIISTALTTIHRALKPGGWMVFGLFASAPDPLGQALTALKIVRSGGHPWSNEEVERQMRDSRFEDVKSFTPAHLTRFTVGRRPR